jgi:hypothetical protein
LLKSLEETIHGVNEREIIVKGGGLYSEALYIEKYTKIDSSNKGEEDLRGYIS